MTTIKKNNFILLVDLNKTKEYYLSNSICECDEDRNFYIQSREKFPKLTKFLAEFGAPIDRPDEIGSCAIDDYIDYHFVSYTVVGDILESDKYEIDLFDGGLSLNVVIDHWYVPNNQKTDRYFTVTVYGVKLPWVLDDPFPRKERFWCKVKKIFKKHNDSDFS